MIGLELTPARARERRSGLPDPLTIFNGGAMTTVPVGGSLSRFVRLASPKRFEPCMMEWQGNIGSKR